MHLSIDDVAVEDERRLSMSWRNQRVAARRAVDIGGDGGCARQAILRLWSKFSSSLLTRMAKLYAQRCCIVWRRW